MKQIFNTKYYTFGRVNATTVKLWNSETGLCEDVKIGEIANKNFLIFNHFARDMKTLKNSNGSDKYLTKDGDIMYGAMSNDILESIGDFNADDIDTKNLGIYYINNKMVVNSTSKTYELDEGIDKLYEAERFIDKIAFVTHPVFKAYIERKDLVKFNEAKKYVRDQLNTFDSKEVDVVKGFIFGRYIANLFPNNPHLLLNGEKGSGKTVLQKFIAATTMGGKVTDDCTKAGIKNFFAGLNGTLMLNDFESDKFEFNKMEDQLLTAFDKDSSTLRSNANQQSLDIKSSFSCVISNIHGLNIGHALQTRTGVVNLNKLNKKEGDVKLRVPESYKDFYQSLRNDIFTGLAHNAWLVLELAEKSMQHLRDICDTDRQADIFSQILSGLFICENDRFDSQFDDALDGLEEFLTAKYNEFKHLFVESDESKNLLTSTVNIFGNVMSLEQIILDLNMSEDLQQTEDNKVVLKHLDAIGIKIVNDKLMIVDGEFVNSLKRAEKVSSLKELEEYGMKYVPSRESGLRIGGKKTSYVYMMI